MNLKTQSCGICKLGIPGDKIAYIHLTKKGERVTVCKACFHEQQVPPKDKKR